MFLAAQGEEKGTQPGIKKLHTEGRYIKDEQGNTVILKGINVASLEWRIDGERVIEKINTVIDDWNVKLIRLPVSQYFWLGIPDPKKKKKAIGDAKAYKKLIDDIVNICMSKGVYIIIDLHHYIAPTKDSLKFWKEVARIYKNNPAVWFGLLNEPHNVSWDVWLHGGKAVDVRSKPPKKPKFEPFKTPGIQKLYDTVRRAGAKDNIIVIGGLKYAYDLSAVIKDHAVDGYNIVYDTHVYDFKHDWDKHFGKPSESIPVLVGEFGPEVPKREEICKNEKNGTQEEYVHKLIQYMNERELSWTAWCFHAGMKRNLIIKGTDYKPSWYGEIVLKELKEQK
jgi:aryl-phospho-beta-D-glucosidase BglC (GH1 family)